MAAVQPAGPEPMIRQRVLRGALVDMGANLGMIPLRRDGRCAFEVLDMNVAGLSMGIGAGVAIGVALGVALHNIALGIAFGAAIGVVFALTMGGETAKTVDRKHGGQGHGVDPRYGGDGKPD